MDKTESRRFGIHALSEEHRAEIARFKAEGYRHFAVADRLGLPEGLVSQEYGRLARDARETLGVPSAGKEEG